MSQVIVYVKAPSNCIVYDKNITLGDVLKMECTNLGVLRKLKQIPLYQFNHEHSIVISILKVIEQIHKAYPNIEIVNCGETDFIVEYKKSTVKNRWVEKLKLLLITIIVFFGSAFTIMTFHVDIGIQKTFARFYEQLMGETKPMITELEISYSIGLAVGIIVFFNHFSKKKLTKDPTPMEVEMKKYNQDLMQTKLAESDEKGHTIDVT
ncbi:MAG: stage V sporulation protein AA [Agathobacter sp.]|nr:stage V sporulation protein AA [Agathobacter sp.]